MAKQSERENKVYISEKNARIYYDELEKIHDSNDINWGDKISILKKRMEKKILTEVTGTNHYDDIFVNNVPKKSGQKAWLIKNRKNRHKNIASFCFEYQSRNTPVILDRLCMNCLFP